MAFKAISSLLGNHDNSLQSTAISQELSKVMGYEVKSIPAGKGGYRIDKKGTVYLNDIDEDECPQTLIGEYKEYE